MAALREVGPQFFFPSPSSTDRISTRPTEVRPLTVESLTALVNSQLPKIFLPITPNRIFIPRIAPTPDLLSSPLNGIADHIMCVGDPIRFPPDAQIVAETTCEEESLLLRLDSLAGGINTILYLFQELDDPEAFTLKLYQQGARVIDQIRTFPLGTDVNDRGEDAVLVLYFPDNWPQEAPPHIIQVDIPSGSGWREILPESPSRASSGGEGSEAERKALALDVQRKIADKFRDLRVVGNQTILGPDQVFRGNTLHLPNVSIYPDVSRGSRKNIPIIVVSTAPVEGTVYVSCAIKTVPYSPNSSDKEFRDFLSIQVPGVTTPIYLPWIKDLTDRYAIDGTAATPNTPDITVARLVYDLGQEYHENDEHTVTTLVIARLRYTDGSVRTIVAPVHLPVNFTQAFAGGEFILPSPKRSGQAERTRQIASCPVKSDRYPTIEAVVTGFPALQRQPLPPFSPGERRFIRNESGLIIAVTSPTETSVRCEMHYPINAQLLAQLAKAGSFFSLGEILDPATATDSSTPIRQLAIIVEVNGGALTVTATIGKTGQEIRIPINDPEETVDQLQHLLRSPIPTPVTVYRRSPASRVYAAKMAKLEKDHRKWGKGRKKH